MPPKKTGKIISFHKTKKSTKPSRPTKKGITKSSSKTSVDFKGVPDTRTESKRTDAALRRMGVTKRDLERCPEISEMLLGALKSKAAIIKTLRFSQDPVVESFLQVYDSLPIQDRDRVPIEALCLKAAVNPHLILGSTLASLKVLRGQESALVAITAHPDVVRRTVRMTSFQENSADRKMLHEAIGFLPTKAGGVNINFMNGAPQFGSKDEESDDDADTFTDSFPTISSSLEEWGEDRRKMLSDGK